MRAINIVFTAAALLLGGSLMASADPWKDESGHGKHGQGEYWVPGHAYGPCEVKREWKGDGEYKEEVKCDDHDDELYYSQPGVVIPLPASRPSINIIVPID